MLIPIGTDRALRRTPLVTRWLVFLNAAVAVLVVGGWKFQTLDIERVLGFGALDPERIRLWGFLTYQFLHDPNDILHLGFNMLFLYVFGCGVEDRLGRLGFLAFYLGGGVVAGIGHCVFSDAPVIGASGAVSAVSGAYLALFPRSQVRVLILLLIITIASIRSLWVIAIFFGLDLLFSLGILPGSGNVAYEAHLAGSVYGFGLCLGLVATGILKQTQYDAFFLLKQWRRRASFRRVAARSGGGVWDAAAARPDLDRRRPLKNRPARDGDDANDHASAPAAEPDEQSRARSEIGALLDDRRLDAAADRYVRARSEGHDVRLTESKLLDIASQLAADNRSKDAAEAYESLLRFYPRSSSADEVRLLLAAIYVRRLGEPDRARPHARAAAERVTEPSRRDLVETLLAECGDG